MHPSLPTPFVITDSLALLFIPSQPFLSNPYLTPIDHASTLPDHDRRALAAKVAMRVGDMFGEEEEFDV